MQSDDLQLLTCKDMAELMQISERYAYLLLQRGEIPHIRLGKSVRVRKSDLAAYLEASLVLAPPVVGSGTNGNGDGNGAESMTPHSSPPVVEVPHSLE